MLHPRRFRVVTRHNTLHRHPHLMGLTDSPLCRKCGAEDGTSAHILCWCEALASMRHVYLGSFFLKPEDIKSQNLKAIWRFSKVPGLPWKMTGAQRAGLFKRLGASRLKAHEPTYQSINHIPEEWRSHSHHGGRLKSHEHTSTMWQDKSWSWTKTCWNT
jgi:hypothetical protein